MRGISFFHIWKEVAFETKQIGKHLVCIDGGALFFGQYDGQNGAFTYTRLAVVDDFGNLVPVN